MIFLFRILRFTVFSTFLISLISPLYAQHDRFYKMELRNPSDNSHTIKNSKGKQNSPSHFKNNYRLVIQTQHQPSDDFVNEQLLDYEMHQKHLHLQAQYGFIYDPFSPEGSFEIASKNGPKKHFTTEKRIIYRNHEAALNMGLKLNTSNIIVFNNLVDLATIGGEDNTFESSFRQQIHTRDQVRQYYFSQTWHHDFDSSNQFKMGIIEDFKHLSARNQADRKDQKIKQQIHLKTPAIGSFIKFQNRQETGLTTAELRFSHLGIRDDTKNLYKDHRRSSFFGYQENTWMLRLHHQLSLSKTQELDATLQLEQSATQKRLQTPAQSISPDAEKEHSLNFTYKLSYTTAPTSGERYKISLRKDFIRPTVQQLNPLLKINRDFIHTAGNFNIKAYNAYKLLLETTQDDWILSAYAGYSNDEILPFFAFKTGHLTTTFRNFKNFFSTGGTIQYQKELFGQRWKTHNSIRFSYAQMSNKNISKPLGNSPKWQFNSEQQVNLGQNWTAGIDFVFQSAYKNNVIKHLSTTQLDLFIEKKIGKRLEIVIFGEDLFKTDRRWEKFLTPDYAFSRNINRDSNTYGFSLRYTLKGANFTAQSIYKPEDTLKNRH